MLVPPLAPAGARARSLRFWDRLALKRIGDRDVLPALAKLQGKRVRVDAPDQGSWFTGRLSSARRLQLCVELVLLDAEIEGRLRGFRSSAEVLTIIRTLDDVVVSNDVVTSRALI
jgi:hypothetical protein